jgi:hypothetical protein
VVPDVRDEIHTDKLLPGSKKKAAGAAVVIEIAQKIRWFPGGWFEPRYKKKAALRSWKPPWFRSGFQGRVARARKARSCTPEPSASGEGELIRRALDLRCFSDCDSRVTNRLDIIGKSRQRKIVMESMVYEESFLFGS